MNCNENGTLVARYVDGDVDNGPAVGERDAPGAVGRRDAQLVEQGIEVQHILAAGRIAHRDMIEAAASCSDPGPDTTNRIIIGRTLVGATATRVVEKAMEIVGGSSFYRAAGLERLFRDVQGARFHPLQEGPQRQLAGRMALGLPIDG